MDMTRQITSWGYIDWIQSGLSSGTSPISIGIVNLLPGRRQAEHTHHSEKQFLYTLTGSGEHIINGQRRRFGPGDSFCLDRGVVHATINLGDETMRELMVSIPVHLPCGPEAGQQAGTGEPDPELARTALREGISRLAGETLDHVNMPIVLTDEDQRPLYSRLLPPSCRECGEQCPLWHSVSELHSDYGATCSSVACPRGLTVLIQPVVLDGVVYGFVKGGLFQQYPNIQGAAEGVYDVPDSTVTATQLFLQDVYSYLANFYGEQKLQRALARGGSSSGAPRLVPREVDAALERLKTDTLDIQIRNHFLFNTLNSIASLAIQDGSMDTYRAIIDLSELLRGLLRREGTRVPLSEEIAFLQRYLNLQLLRYESTLQVTWRRCAAAERTVVPHNFLQPIVENTLAHGYDRGDQLKKICIETALEGGRTVVTVRDNGRGMAPEVLARLRRSLYTGAVHGLPMVNRKLAGVFGQDFSFEIHSAPGEGTVCRLSFPR